MEQYSKVSFLSTMVGGILFLVAAVISFPMTFYAGSSMFSASVLAAAPILIMSVVIMMIGLAIPYLIQMDLPVNNQTLVDIARLVVVIAQSLCVLIMLLLARPICSILNVPPEILQLCIGFSRFGSISTALGTVAVSLWAAYKVRPPIELVFVCFGAGIILFLLLLFVPLFIRANNMVVLALGIFQPIAIFYPSWLSISGVKYSLKS